MLWGSGHGAEYARLTAVDKAGHVTAMGTDTDRLASAEAKSGSLTREAVDRIRHAIVTGRLELGEHLSETLIAKALGMSKAPVRAAFIELREEGLVTVVPQSGTYVFSPGPDELRQMSAFRALLEDRALRDAFARDPGYVISGFARLVEIMRQAIAEADWDAYRRADTEFHLVFLSACGNPYIAKAHNLTASALEALRVRFQGGEGSFRARSFGEHVEMLELLRLGALDAACDVLKKHILLINEWVNTSPLQPGRMTRKEKAEGRDYRAVFAR